MKRTFLHEEPSSSAKTDGVKSFDEVNRLESRDFSFRPVDFQRELCDVDESMVVVTRQFSRTEFDEEEEYDPLSVSKNSTLQRLETGYLGEKITADFLNDFGEESILRQLLTEGPSNSCIIFNPSDWEVVWLNKHAESGAPYDLTATHKPSQKVFYFEVKSSHHNIRTFAISTQELEACRSYAENYFFVRVFNVQHSGVKEGVSTGLKGTTIQILKNVWQRLVRKDSFLSLQIATLL